MLKRAWWRKKPQSMFGAMPRMATMHNGEGGDGGSLRPRIHSRDAIRRLRAHVLEHKGHDNVERVGLKDSIWADFYHHTLTASWPTVVVWAIGLYVVVNLLFALLYALVPGQITCPHPPTLLDLFFFSVQTLSTVGYGVMAPTGPVANGIVSFEVLIGMMINALATGTIFARIARPRARVIFSSRAVISKENGIPALCIRIANCRKSVILSLDVEVALSRLILSPSGHLVRQFDQLLLVQSHVPVLRFAFVVAHVISPASPLANQTAEELREEEAEIIVTVTGTDEAMGQTVFARTAYGFDRILHNHRFVDIIDPRPDGGLSVDYSRFHETESHSEHDTPHGDEEQAAKTGSA